MSLFASLCIYIYLISHLNDNDTNSKKITAHNYSETFLYQEKEVKIFFLNALVDKWL